MMGDYQQEQLKRWAVETLPESVKREVELFLLGYDLALQPITSSASILIAYAQIIQYLDAHVPQDSQNIQNWLIKPGYDELLAKILKPID